MKRILILVPSSTARGGIANYFNILEQYWTLPIDYFIRGARKQPHSHSKIYLIILYLYDIQRYIFILLLKRYKIVHLNTSLGFAGLYRDAIFLIIAKLLNRRTIVFFRGLDISIQEKINDGLIKIFNKSYLKSDMIVVLSSQFKNILLNLGYKNKIVVENTIVEDRFFVNTSNESIVNRIDTHFNSHEFRILFLARIEKEKGIYELLNAFSILNSYNCTLKLFIAGDGKELENSKNYVKENKIKNVTFLGYLEGEDKIELLSNCDVFVLPSRTEGMPNSLIEAMSFGLPVIVSKVGGIPDIVINNENGILLENISSSIISRSIEILISDKTLYKKIAINNFTKAKEYFLASKASRRLESYYLELF